MEINLNEWMRERGERKREYVYLGAKELRIWEWVWPAAVHPVPRMPHPSWFVCPHRLWRNL